MRYVFLFRAFVDLNRLLYWAGRCFAYLSTPERIARGLVLDCSAVNFLDATGVHALEDVSLLGLVDCGTDS